MATGQSSDGGISGATLEKAIRELNESPEGRPEAILQLRLAIEQCEQDLECRELLEGKRRDDKFLLRFLRARKFDIDRATQLYVNYHRYLLKYSDLLEDCHPKSVEPFLRSGTVAVLNSRLKNGSKLVCLFPTRYIHLEGTSPAMAVRTLVLILDKLLDDEETQVHGISVFDHLEGVTFYHVMRKIRSDRSVRSAIIELQDAFPMRLKGIHLVHPPWYVSIVLNLGWPFLKQKTRDRIHVHKGDLSTLRDYIDPEYLPAEFGGHLPPLDAAQTVLKLFEQELNE